MKIKSVSIKFNQVDLLREMGRKVLHVGSCSVALFLIGKKWMVLEMLFLPAMALGFYISEKIEFFGKNISFGKKRKWGGIMLAVGLSLIMASPVDYEVKKFAIFILMIADVMAAIIGKIIPVKKVEILGAYKSIGGSTAFAVGVLIALALSFGGFSDLGSLPVLRVALTILVLEFFEFLNWRSIDNLSLPLAALLAGSILFT